mmetsp:Transcript_153735/g.283309  ORF Transcript_153735/g.283309 Transcript_153735/m.283309 type:complete len:308 (+) Transcript_153735:1-924(+)
MVTVEACHHGTVRLASCAPAGSTSFAVAIGAILCALNHLPLAAFSMSLLALVLLIWSWHRHAAESAESDIDPAVAVGTRMCVSWDFGRICLGDRQSAKEDDPVPEWMANNANLTIRSSPSPSEMAVDKKSKKAPAPKESQLARYLVDNSSLRAKTKGLAYRYCKSWNADAISATLKPRKEEEVLAKWGDLVHGRDQGDGWLKVETKFGSEFLPMAIQNKNVITLADGAGSIYRVDNSLLKADTYGLAYRYAKDEEKKESPAYESSVARWQTLVSGTEVDGWLRVGNGINSRYLPMRLDDIPVLEKWP